MTFLSGECWIKRKFPKLWENGTRIQGDAGKSDRNPNHDSGRQTIALSPSDDDDNTETRFSKIHIGSKGVLKYWLSRYPAQELIGSISHPVVFIYLNWWRPHFWSINRNEPILTPDAWPSNPSPQRTRLERRQLTACQERCRFKRGPWFFQSLVFEEEHVFGFRQCTISWVDLPPTQ